MTTEENNNNSVYTRTNDVPDDIRQFFLGPIITPEEYDMYKDEIKSNLTNALDYIDSKGVKQAYDEYIQSIGDTNNNNNNNESEENIVVNSSNISGSGTINLDTIIPRSYQISLLEIAKKENIIVHLGTGTGKTLIALLLIRDHLATSTCSSASTMVSSNEYNDTKDEYENMMIDSCNNDNGTKTTGKGQNQKRNKKIVVFLVPSIALAEQHTKTLSSSLPYKIGSAYGTSAFRDESISDDKKNNIFYCDILVATHGCYLDLLSHYSDWFSISTCSLLILDECHNCIGKSPYANIMKSYYHQCTNKYERPKVLGLTASPLISVRKNYTDIQLSKALDDLEAILDCRIVSVPYSSSALSSASSSHNDNIDDDTDLSIRYSSAKVGTCTKKTNPDIATIDANTGTSNPNLFLKQSATERNVYYDSMPTSISTKYVPPPPHNSPLLHPQRDLMTFDSSSDDEYIDRSQMTTNDATSIVHRSRRLVFHQIEQLYFNLGPVPVYMYCIVLQSELTIKVDETETTKQFKIAQQYVSNWITFTEQECLYYNETQPLQSIDDAIYYKHLTSIHMKDVTNTIRLHPNDGISPKLHSLVNTLQSEHEQEVVDRVAYGSDDAVSVVFVQRRMTALALKLFFSYRRKVMDKTTARNGVVCNDIPMKSTTRLILESLFRGKLNKDNAPIFSEPQYGVFSSKKRKQSTDEKKSNKTCADICSDIDQQFEDADSDMSMSTSKEDDLISPGDASIIGNQQFDDAPTTLDPSYFSTEANRSQEANRSHAVAVFRCGVLVRCPEELLKSLAHEKGKSVNTSSDEEGSILDDILDDQYLHTKSSTKGVIESLHRGEINVLIATPIIEEGLDVQTCSVVAVFDAITNIKSYIQMKGRARRKNAKLYVFVKKSDINESCAKTLSKAAAGLSLDEGQRIEKRLQEFVVKRQNTFAPWKVASALSISRISKDMESDDELRAVMTGVYEVEKGKVSLETAKSLLYRVMLQQPIDPSTRQSKVAMEAYLPSFDADIHTLLLPSYIDSTKRRVILPCIYQKENKKQRQAILCLMACVRLHQLTLLNDRLLPLSVDDIRKRIFSITNDQMGNACASLPTQVPMSDSTHLFVYKFVSHGSIFDQYQLRLNGKGHKLAIVMTIPLPTTYRNETYNHKEFGIVTYGVSYLTTTHCGEEEKQILNEFFTCIWNARWRRRTKPSFYRIATTDRPKVMVAPYSVGCVDRYGSLDFHFMKMIINESKRSIGERSLPRKVLQCANQEARLCCPQYNMFSIFVCQGSSGMTCDAAFPGQEYLTDDIATYQDFFRVKHKIEVSANDVLVTCQQIWEQPNGTAVSSMFQSKELDTDTKTSSEQFRKVRLLPEALCVELELANASLFLEALMLPQFLFSLERFLTAEAFIKYCKDAFPNLAKCLLSRPVDDVIGLLSSKRCAEGVSYETFEWLGDAVLKLSQTDAIMKSSDLENFVQNIHGGYLDLLRHAMVSNETFTQKCFKLSINNFILTSKLSRGEWIPAVMEKYSPVSSEICMSENGIATGKVCADVIEACVGFVYHWEGYEYATRVADELHLLACKMKTSSCKVEQPVGYVNHATQAEIKVALALTGYGNFRNPSFVLEALTHPTYPSSETRCYEKLEWIGDAVMCLAARTWIFNNMGSEKLGNMVLLESCLVSNETFAFLSQRKNLQKFLRHGDESLPPRLSQYIDSTCKTDKARLWSTEPPKVVADLLEAIVGAVHVDGGFYEGQCAAQHILKPVFDLLSGLVDPLVVTNNARRVFCELAGKRLMLLTSTSAKENEQVSDMACKISCFGKSIVGVEGSTSTQANQRACTLCLDVLQQDDTLLNRFTKVRSELDRC